MSWLQQNLALVAELTAIHLAITLPAVVLSVLVAVPIGRLAFRWKWIGGPTVAALAVLYAVPSLPLLIIVPTVIGTELRSPLNLVVVLAIYGVAVLVRSVVDGFASVPNNTQTAATAIGYGGWTRLWVIELPLAAPIIIAGLRVVVVSTISLVTIGSVIGIRSLGTLFTDGFQRGIVAEVMTGLVVTVALAVVLDRVCAVGGRLLLPWTVPAARRRSAVAR